MASSLRKRDRALDPNTGYYPAPFSQSPLSPVLGTGLYAPGILGLFSAGGAITLVFFIVYRMYAWKKHYKTFVGYNQYVVLIMNLLIADLFQAVSFLFSFHWIRLDAVLAPSSACFTQGFLLNIGDLSSGFFVLAVALHTFYTAVKGSRIEFKPFVASVVGIWAFALLLTVIGPGVHGHQYFVKAGAWCWASSDYEKDRLGLHYIWIFIVQFGTILVYVAVLLHLKATMKRIMPQLRHQSETYAKVDHAAKLMVLYPFFYILLTLPLSAGRMWSMAHSSDNLPDSYQLVAGSFLASCGWVDALLYALTRKTLLGGGVSGTKKFRGDVVKDHSSSSPSMGLDTITAGIMQTRTITVTGNVMELQSDDEDERGRKDSKRIYNNFDRSTHSPTGSLDPIISAARYKTNAAKNDMVGNVHISATRLEDPSDDDTSTAESVTKEPRVRIASYTPPKH